MAETPEKPLPESALTPEKQLLAHAPPNNWQVPPEVIRCYEEIVSRFLLPQEVLDLLVLPETMDSQMIKLMKAFKLFPDDYPKLILLIRSNRGIPEGSVGDEILLRMYGMDNTRNFLLAIAVCQQVLGKKFEWESETRPKHSPKQVLQFALKAQQSYQGRAVELAFSAGLVFDLLAMTAHKMFPGQARMKKFINDAFEEGLLVAKIGLELCRRVPDLRLVDYVFSACLIRDAGKVVAAILKEQALDCFLREERDVLPLSTEILCEEALFGVSSDVYASLVCSCLPPFKAVRDALRFQRKPYILKHRQQSDLANLAMTCSLARQMARRPLEPAQKEDPAALLAQVTENWLTAEFRELGVSPETLLQVWAKLKEART